MLQYKGVNWIEYYPVVGFNPKALFTYNTLVMSRIHLPNRPIIIRHCVSHLCSDI